MFLRFYFFFFGFFFFLFSFLSLFDLFQMKVLSHSFSSFISIFLAFMYYVKNGLTRVNGRGHCFIWYKFSDGETFFLFLLCPFSLNTVQSGLLTSKFGKRKKKMYACMKFLLFSFWRGVEGLIVPSSPLFLFTGCFFSYDYNRSAVDFWVSFFPLLTLNIDWVIIQIITTLVAAVVMGIN